MMPNFCSAISASALVLCFAGTSYAATLGFPSFTTAPTTVNVVNEFGPDLTPTPSYTLSVHSTIATAQGVPELVGQAIDFIWFNGNVGTGVSFLNIGGQELLFDTLDNDREVLVIPPYTEVYDPITSISTFSYSGIFTGFGPRTGTIPEFVLQFSIDLPIPTKNGFWYCTAGQATCEFSNIAGLTDLNGQPATLFESFTYPEGAIHNAVLTFSMVDGRPVAPVPLPAGGMLLVCALAGLAALRRKVNASS